MPPAMGRNSESDLPPRSTRTRSSRESGTPSTNTNHNTTKIAQQQRATEFITISDSSDPVMPANLESGYGTGNRPARGTNRQWGRSGKAPQADSDNESDISETVFDEEDYYFSEEDGFDDNQSIISVESSDSGSDEYPLSSRPWSEFTTSQRKAWEMMYRTLTARCLHDSWEMTELYQKNKDDEMLRYIIDHPLPTWVIPQDEAHDAYQRLAERQRWRGLGIPIYGPHPTGRDDRSRMQMPINIPPGHLPRDTRLAPGQLPQHNALQDVAQQQILPSQNGHPSNVAQQTQTQQERPQPAQPALQPSAHAPASSPPAAPQSQPQSQSQSLPTRPQPNLPQNVQQGPHLPNLPQQNLPPNLPAPPHPNVPLHGLPYTHSGMPPPPFHPNGYPHQPGPYTYPYNPYGQPHPQPHMGPPFHPGPYQHNPYGHPGMGGGHHPPGPPGQFFTPQQFHPPPYQRPNHNEPPKRRPKKDTPPPQSPPPPPQTPPYPARKRPVDKKPGNKPGRKANRKHAEAEEFPWTRKLDFNLEKARAKWDLNVYDRQTLDDMEATRTKNIAVIDDIDAKVQEQQRIARAAKKMKEKAGNPSEVDGKKVRQKREGRPKGADAGGDPYHSGVFAFASDEDQVRAAELGFVCPDDVIDAGEKDEVPPDKQASIKIYWDPGKKGTTENLEQAKFSVRDTVVTRKQLENTPILTRLAAECVIDFCPDMLWRTMLLRITSEAGLGNKDVRDRFCYNGCYCDKATITKRISAALGQKQTQPKSKGYQPGEWEWYDQNVKDFSKYIDYFGMRTSHRNMLKIQIAGEKRKRDTNMEPSAGGENEQADSKDDSNKRQKSEGAATATEAGLANNDELDGGNESGDESDDSDAVSLQDSDDLDKMAD